VWIGHYVEKPSTATKNDRDFPNRLVFQAKTASGQRWPSLELDQPRNRRQQRRRSGSVVFLHRKSGQNASKTEMAQREPGAEPKA